MFRGPRDAAHGGRLAVPEGANVSDAAHPTVPRPDCFLCETEGHWLYRGVPDLLFASPGRWDHRRCPNCGMAWIDPAPAPEDLGRYYRNYYTHEAASGESPAAADTCKARARRAALAVSGIERGRRNRDLMYLYDLRPGRLLDVGCGRGTQLASFRVRGWQVQGQELDPRAADQARRVHGIPVHVGPLRTAPFADGSFDAIVMNHVVEHLVEPVADLGACRRFLKPGGRIVVVTPNIESLGHRRFGVRWWGLDPPRHLHVFSARALAAAARRAGFVRLGVRTTAVMAEWVARMSLDLAARGTPQAGRPPTALQALRFQLRASLWHAVRPTSGEEIILTAT